MSQPTRKPWDRRMPGVVNAPLSYRSTDFANGHGPTASRPPNLTRGAPPLPPRPVQQNYRPAYSSFPSSYSPFGGSPYGGYSHYSPYSYGGMGYSRFHMEDVPPSRFVQQAEESSRGAFQSVESIVHAFSSVSMMLDATFSAVYNSFRAVLDVANHFSRLRVHFTKVLSAFALVRTLRYLYWRLKRILGLRSDAETEALWADSAASAVVPAGGLGGSSENSVKSWPIFLFFAVVFGGPYLIWKLLRSEDSAEESGNDWASGEGDHVVARAEYDFTAATEEELSFQAGNMLNLAPKEQQPRVRGWYLGSVDGQTSGLVPANYVKILGKRKGRRQAELERLAQQQGQEVLGTAPGSVTVQVPASGDQPQQEALLESMYGTALASSANPAAEVNSNSAEETTEN